MTDIEMAAVLRDVWYEIPNSTRCEIAERLEEQATELTQMLTALDGSADLIENLKAEVERLTLTVRKLQGNQAALESEIDRLLGQLSGISGKMTWVGDKPMTARDALTRTADHIEKLEADNARLNDALRQAVLDAAEWARKAGEAQGKLEISEAAGILDGWIRDCKRLEADNARLREHLESAIDTLRDAEVCDDTCVHCNDARAALAKRGLEIREVEG